MEKFNVNKIIEQYKLNPEELAPVLFPYIKYPRQAFDRVLRGETYLDTRQVETLAAYLNAPISDLYDSDGWKAKSNNGNLTFLKDNYKAVLGYNGVFLTLYKGCEIITQEITSSNSMTIEEFIKYIELIIKNYNNGNN